MEWYRNLRIVLSTEDKLPFLEQPIHVLPVPHQGQANPPDVIATHQAWVKAQKEIVGLMLMTMDPEIQKTLEHLGAYDMLNELKTLKLKPRALSLYMGDGHRAAVEAISDFYLCLPSGLVLILHNCHYAPSITRRIILVSRLYKDGFINHFENDNSISVCKNNMIYFNVIPRDDIYKIVISSSNTNECSMYAVTNKRAKFNLNSALLWHYRLKHINKKRIEKLQHDGLLDTTDIKSFEKCVACMSDRLCLYVDAEEHELGDLGEPANYKAALLDPESDKWLNAMNVEMQSIKDNEFGRIDYEETFSPVADIRAIRILIDIAVFYDYEIWQMDVKTAFLNGYLNEEVYMEQPEGFVSQKYPDRVCKLKRSIYRLKQASRQWNKWFDDEIKRFGFSQNRDDPCVYVKASRSYVNVLILYVDDICIMRNNIPMLQDRLIGICQSAYIEKILKRFYMENSKHGTIPMQEKLKFSKSQGASTPAEIQRMQNIPYALANPGDAHWTAVKNILKYLRNTKDMFLVYGGVVDWKSTKQGIFATSSTDVEHTAAFDASKEVVWIRKFISGLGIIPTIEEPINMYCDNTRAITIAKDHGVTKGTRHFYVKVYYLWKTIEMGDVRIEKVDTDDNLVGPFTKALVFPKHSELTEKIGMIPASILM
nr:hypothetical protein [Tanacetum cinerariifolium]